MQENNNNNDKAAGDAALLHDPDVHVWTSKINGLTVVNMRDVDENLQEPAVATPQPAAPVADTATSSSNAASLVGGKLAVPARAVPASAATSVTQAQLNMLLARMHGRQAEQTQVTASDTGTGKIADSRGLSNENTEDGGRASQGRGNGFSYRQQQQQPQQQAALPRSPPPPFPFRADTPPARPTAASRSPKRSSLSSASQDHPFPAPTQGAASAFEYIPGTSLPSGRTTGGREVKGAARAGGTESGTDQSEDGKPLVLFHDPLWGDTGGAMPPSAAMAPRQESAGRPTVRTPRRTRPFMDVPYTESKPARKSSTPAPPSTPPAVTQPQMTATPAAANNTAATTIGAATGSTTSSAAPPVVTPTYTVPSSTPPALVPMVATGGSAGYFVPAPRPTMGMIPTSLAAGAPAAAQPFPVGPSTALPMMAAGQPQAMLSGGYPVYSFPVQYVTQPGYANMVAFNPGLQYYPVSAAPGGVALPTQFLPPGFAPMPAQMAMQQGAAANFITTAPTALPLPQSRPGTNIEAPPFTPGPGETR